MKLFPAIDIKGAQVVRLTKGDYGQVEVYNNDPAAVAAGFAELGASALHVVDLDGAKDGGLSNYDIIERIIKAQSMFTQVGGGIRDEERIKKYLDIGVGRVILGTAAINDYAFLEKMVNRYGEKIAVGVDAKNGMVAIDGWLTITGVDSVEFCGRLRDSGVKTVIYTDIDRDGAMKGTNREIYTTLSERVKGLNIVASGGVSSLEDIKALRSTGLYGAIIGKAIYNGAVKLEDALRCAGED
ncbi:MAG: 1-(5-phosphoribosyl)-5-[(5-phosphoribosylamino)methylideneamino]imidazole-4-carboxamide isomerase [Clostridiales bacterium]|nr:1-(5-phosphoribosyl)-5-[(5-phosphoribosylamino)methylideneamino]imidazole-4-carboxamide isomerase [Clostridiales bacterium]